jgi:hypothetical protein
MQSNGSISRQRDNPHILTPVQAPHRRQHFQIPSACHINTMKLLNSPNPRRLRP